MKIENCFYLGKITRIIGFKGEVVAFIDADKPENYKNLDAIFLNMKGKLIPYFIEKTEIRNKNNQFTLKFQDVDSHEDAQPLTGAEIYLPLDVLPPLSGNDFYFHEVTGFKVIDEEKGAIGEIIQVLDYPGNPLFEIEFKGKTILIPVKDEIINKVDRENKTIHLKAPEGLIDVYLDED